MITQTNNIKHLKSRNLGAHIIKFNNYNKNILKGVHIDLSQVNQEKLIHQERVSLVFQNKEVKSPMF